MARDSVTTPVPDDKAPATTPDPAAPPADTPPADTTTPPPADPPKDPAPKATAAAAVRGKGKTVTVTVVGRAFGYTDTDGNQQCANTGDVITISREQADRGIDFGAVTED